MTHINDLIKPKKKIRNQVQFRKDKASIEKYVKLKNGLENKEWCA